MFLFEKIQQRNSEKNGRLKNCLHFCKSTILYAILTPRGRRDLRIWNSFFRWRWLIAKVPISSGKRSVEFSEDLVEDLAGESFMVQTAHLVS